MFITAKIYFVWTQESRPLQKIYSGANPLSKVDNGRFRNNEDHANTQNSTFHPENNAYRYIKEKRTSYKHLCFWEYNAWTPNWHELDTVLLLLQALFFRSEHTKHSLSFQPGNRVSFLVAEGGGWTGSPTNDLDSEAKESITSFKNSNLDFGFLTVSLYKI